MLIVYFSQFGRTRAAAKEMQKLTGGTLAELKPVQPYPKRYDQLIDLAKEEIRRNFHPEIQPLTVDLNDYDTVFVGYPTWWYQEPMIIDSFFANYDLADKSIIPFTTSGSTPIEEGLPILEKVVTAAHAQITASLTANSKRDIKNLWRRIILVLVGRIVRTISLRSTLRLDTALQRMSGLMSFYYDFE